MPLATNNLSYVIAKYSHILIENCEFFMPHQYLTPTLKAIRWNFATVFGMRKLEWWAASSAGEKSWCYIEPFWYRSREVKTENIRRAPVHTCALFAHQTCPDHYISAYKMLLIYAVISSLSWYKICYCVDK